MKHSIRDALASAPLLLAGLAGSSPLVGATGFQEKPPAPAASTSADAPAALAASYRVEPIVDAEGKSTVPATVPEPFAKLLAPAGLRVFGPDGKPLCSLWLRQPLPAPAATPGVSNVLLPRIAPGSFVGILEATGSTSDYRDLPIDAGTYGLRYFHQPSDGNHLGTSDSRDFLIVTSLAEERDPAPVTDKAALVALSVAISPSDHAVVLYAAPASTPPPADGAPRIVKRGELDEWALEVELPLAVEGSDAKETLRLAVVLVGHTAH